MLGLDIGDKRIGVSLSDPQGMLASPLTIIGRRDNESDIRAIGEIVGLHQVERIIAGLPLSMDGGFSKQTEKVRAFVESLRCGIKVPVEYRDERLSTVSARRLMRNGRNKKTGYDDAVAASIILQSYLDEEAG
ncbi:MAG: Holliday junction resolvase RuvX [Dehalococcoidales bacterium]